MEKARNIAEPPNWPPSIPFSSGYITTFEGQLQNAIRQYKPIPPDLTPGNPLAFRYVILGAILTWPYTTLMEQSQVQSVFVKEENQVFKIVLLGRDKKMRGLIINPSVENHEQEVSGQDRQIFTETDYNQIAESLKTDGVDKIMVRSHLQMFRKIAIEYSMNTIDPGKLKWQISAFYPSPFSFDTYSSKLFKPEVTISQEGFIRLNPSNFKDLEENIKLFEQGRGRDICSKVEHAFNLILASAQMHSSNMKVPITTGFLASFVLGALKLNFKDTQALHVQPNVKAGKVYNLAITAVKPKGSWISKSVPIIVNFEENQKPIIKGDNEGAKVQPTAGDMMDHYFKDHPSIPSTFVSEFDSAIFIKVDMQKAKLEMERLTSKIIREYYSGNMDESDRSLITRQMAISSEVKNIVTEDFLTKLMKLAKLSSSDEISEEQKAVVEDEIRLGLGKILTYKLGTHRYIIGGCYLSNFLIGQLMTSKPSLDKWLVQKQSGSSIEDSNDDVTSMVVKQQNEPDIGYLINVYENEAEIGAMPIPNLESTGMEKLICVNLKIPKRHKLHPRDELQEWHIPATLKISQVSSDDTIAESEKGAAVDSGDLIKISSHDARLLLKLMVDNNEWFSRKKTDKTKETGEIFNFDSVISSYLIKLKRSVKHELALRALISGMFKDRVKTFQPFASGRMILGISSTLSPTFLVEINVVGPDENVENKVCKSAADKLNAIRQPFIRDSSHHVAKRRATLYVISYNPKPEKNNEFIFSMKENSMDGQRSKFYKACWGVDRKKRSIGGKGGCVFDDGDKPLENLHNDNQMGEQEEHKDENQQENILSVDDDFILEGSRADQQIMRNQEDMDNEIKSPKKFPPKPIVQSNSINDEPNEIDSLHHDASSQNQKYSDAAKSSEKKLDEKKPASDHVSKQNLANYFAYFMHQAEQHDLNDHSSNDHPDQDDPQVNIFDGQKLANQLAASNADWSEAHGGSGFRQQNEQAMVEARDMINQEARFSNDDGESVMKIPREEIPRFEEAFHPKFNEFKIRV